MGKETGIAWCDHTANFWMGCQRVSPGCEQCYAESFVTKRMRLPVWGPPSTTERKRTQSAWRDVPAWDRAAKRDGVRRRLFVSSLADIFEDHPQVAPWRAEALALLERCTSLDVLLLTKRPQNIRAMVPPAWLDAWPAHVWIGTTVEDKKRAEERIPELLRVPARVRFLSCEPLLEEVDLDPPTCQRCGGHDHEPGEDGVTPFCADCGESDGNGEEMGFGAWLDACASEDQPGISWVIVGGESGPGARPFDLAWARSIARQCHAAGVALFVKQMGDNAVETREECPAGGGCGLDECAIGCRYLRTVVAGARFRARAGADPAEWPDVLRVQEFPA